MEVNIDYIGLVIKESESLKYQEFPIERRNEDELLLMENIVRDDSKSLIDLQTRLNHLSLTHDHYNICIPQEYYKTYVDSPSLPDRISIYEYEELCRKKLEDLLRIQKRKEYKGEYYDALEILKRYKRNLKEKFYESVYNFLLAEDYISSMGEIKRNPNVLMYSTETKGWSRFEYIISEDINIEVRTNFCYGSSSYFRVNLSYKGINILPYSDIVTYYYAKMADFDRYTRQYRSERRNWPVALNFVIDIANLASKDPLKFVEEWVKGELDIMMKGLRRIQENVKEEIQFYKVNPNSEADQYITVRNIREKDIEDFKAFPDEMEVTYKAYKIAGSLYFMENLKKLESLYPFITEYIKELKAINLEIQPEIIKIKTEVIQHLKDHNFQLKDLKRALEKIENKLKPHERYLESKLKGIHWKQHQKIREDYMKTNTRYASLIVEQDALNKKIWNMEDLIKKRESFQKVLEDALILFEKTFVN